MKIGDPFNPYRMFTGIFIPTGIVRLTTIGPGTKLCYGCLLRFGGKNGACFPSVKRLTAELGVSERQTQSYLAELQREQLIRKNPRPGTSDLIEFLWHEALAKSKGVKDASLPGAKNIPAEVKDNSSSECKNLHPKRVNEHHHQESDDEESHVLPSVSGGSGKKPSLEGVSTSLEPTAGGLGARPHTCESYGSPEEELIALSFSKGQALKAMTLRRIREDLEVRGVTLASFVDLVRPHFQNNIRNPTGFLISRARNPRTLMEAAVAPKPPAEPVDRCERCREPKGRGLITEGMTIVPCPVCSTPEFREEFAAEEAEREARRAGRKNQKADEGGA